MDYYHYLSLSGSYKVEDINDKSDFQETLVIISSSKEFPVEMQNMLSVHPLFLQETQGYHPSPIPFPKYVKMKKGLIVMYRFL